DLEALEPHFRVGHALAGFQLVLPAVPRADDVRLVVVVGLAEIVAVRAEQVDDLVADDALAGRAALVQAVIAGGIERSGMAIDADFGSILADDADVAVFHLEVFANEYLLRHPASSHPC